MRPGTIGIVVLLLAALGACQTPRRVPRASLITAEPSCADFQATIYFENESARLTPEARAVLNAAAKRARPCHFAAIDVLGLSDAKGAAAANLALSAARARTVAKALSKRGLPPLSFGVVAAGAAGAETAAGQEQPLRRRVDLAFHNAPARSRPAPG